MRLVEIRLLDGPNLYLLEPAVRVEVVVGRRRTWFGSRMPAKHALVRLGQAVPAKDAPSPVAALADNVRRLHRVALNGRVRVTIHRTSEPGHWVVAFPWEQRNAAETIANAAYRLAETPSERLFERAIDRARRADGPPPEWVTNANPGSRSRTTSTISLVVW